MSLQKQISLHAYNLTDMEKNFLHNIIENKEKFEYKTFTIALLSDTFNVSKTSVHRLTKKLEYSSFLHFKDEFFLRFRINEDMIIEKNSDVDLLLDTFHAVQESITEEMIKELIMAKRITIYGMGMNSFIGKMFQIKLQLLGKHVEQYDDSRYMRVFPAPVTPWTRDLVNLLNPPSVILLTTLSCSGFNMKGFMTPFPCSKLSFLGFFINPGITSKINCPNG